jgi:hypothetical protein
MMSCSVFRNTLLRSHALGCVETRDVAEQILAAAMEAA